MEVKVKNLKYLGEDKDSCTFKLEGPVSIKELLLENNFDLEKTKGLFFLVNGRQKRIDCLLHDGDEVAVIPLITGG